MSVWDEVVGQPRVVEVLQRAAMNPATLAHAWLFTGPPGSGRSVAARALAAALLCDLNTSEANTSEASATQFSTSNASTGATNSGTQPPGCGVCNACRTVHAGAHPDVTTLATDKVTMGIDEVRSLVGLAARTPVSGKYRIIIIEDADRMLEKTTNVLLKPIEEPPPHVIWMLCAPSPADVLPTIQSRCRAVTLQVPPLQAVADVIVQRDGVDPATALAAARQAQCHVGIARRLARDPGARQRRSSVFDTVLRIGSAGQAVLAAETLVKVAKEEAEASSNDRNAAEEAELRRVLGLEPQGTVPSALRTQFKQLAEGQARRAKRANNDVLDRTLLDVMSLYRDVLVLQYHASARVDLINGDDPVGRNAAEVIARHSIPAETLERLDAVTTARKRIAANVPPLLAIEALCATIYPKARR
ncbi:MAG: DNA polymerase III subunit delta' [Cellulomonadaceae bacterium]|nr:DNA polymerase III subunit delta' [Cellulomonadaceae bacterium]